MFEYLYEWIQNLAFYMVLVMVVIQILPNTEYKKYVRFFTGLLLILLLATPILKLFGMEKNLSQIYTSPSYEAEMKRIEQATQFLEEVEPTDFLEKETTEVEEIQIGR